MLPYQKGDTFEKDGKKYINGSAASRISLAAAELTGSGKDAWPILFAHLNDKRPSYAAREVIGPYDVGHQCYYILYYQVADPPQGYYKSKVRKGKDGKYHSRPGAYVEFKPDLITWLETRKHKSLNEMRLEVMKNILVKDNEIGYPDKAMEDEIQGILNKEINRLQEAVNQEKISGVKSYGPSKQIQKQMEVTIPKIRFEKMDFLFALDFIRKMVSNKYPYDRVKYFLMFDADKLSNTEFTHIGDNIKVRELMDIACKAADVTWEIGGGTIIFRKK